LEPRAKQGPATDRAPWCQAKHLVTRFGTFGPGVSGEVSSGEVSITS